MFIKEITDDWAWAAWTVGLSFLLGGLLLLGVYLAGQLYQVDFFKDQLVLVTEAADQSFNSTYAVGCVLRNRNWQHEAFAGYRRKDALSFYRRQPETVKQRAAQIAHSLRQGSPDTTDGATHVEAVRRFGKPYWARAMELTKVIDDLYFYKEKKW